MRLRLLLNFRALLFRTQYIGLSHAKTTQRRNGQFAKFSGNADASQSIKQARNLVQSYSNFNTLKLVLITKVDWLTGDSMGLISAARALYPKFTPNVGKRILYKGFDTRLLAFKKDHLFFDARRNLNLVPEAVAAPKHRNVGFLATSAGTIKYKAKTWGTYLYNSSFFLGQWAQLYRLGRVSTAVLIHAGYSSVCFNLQRIGYDLAPEAGYTNVTDPRSSLQHVFTAAVNGMFQKHLFDFFGNLLSATRGCGSLTAMHQYTRSAEFSVLPGNHLSSVYNRESRTNTLLLAWFIGLNADTYLSFFKHVVLTRPAYGNA